MRSGIAGIDHVVVGVRDLDRACAQWRRLGFVPSPRGRHIGQRTANCCIMFAADYVELLVSVDPEASAAAQSGVGPGVGNLRLDAFLAAREGPMAAAFAPAGTAETARAALLRLGLSPSEPAPLERRIELPEGPATLGFRLVALPPETTPGLDGFLCEHLTPGLLRRPEWLLHPNGATGLDGIHILIETTAALLPAYDRLFGVHEVTTTDSVVTVHAGRHRIMFSTPDDFRTMHPALELPREFSLPVIVALEIRVAGARDTAEYLARQQIAFAAMPEGSLAVPASEANGAVLVFTEQSPQHQTLKRKYMTSPSRTT
jgi:hypothetical protein